MRIPLRSSEPWERLNSEFRLSFIESGLALTDMHTVQVYQGIYHALLESCQALVETFPHKKLIAVPDRYRVFFDSVTVHLSRLGIKCFSYSRENTPDVKLWLESVQKDLLLVSLIEDDPITGKLLDNSWIESELLDKKVFRLRLFFEKHRYFQPDLPQPYELQLRSCDRSTTVVLGGERARLRPAIAPRLCWPDYTKDLIRELVSSVSMADQSKLRSEILNFEKKLSKEFMSFFNEDEKRIYDRAVFYSSKIDGEALIRELAGPLIATLGSNVDIETLSPCRWNFDLEIDPIFSEKEARNLSAEEMRGLVLVGPKLCSTVSENLELARKKLLKLQGN